MEHLQGEQTQRAGGDCFIVGVVHIHIHVCTHARTHTHTHLPTPTPTHIHTYTHTHSQTQGHLQTKAGGDDFRAAVGALDSVCHAAHAGGAEVGVGGHGAVAAALQRRHDKHALCQRKTA